MTAGNGVLYFCFDSSFTLIKIYLGLKTYSFKPSGEASDPNHRNPHPPRPRLSISA